MRDAETLSPDALERIRRRMDRVDAQPPDIRALVHEYSWATVKTLLDLGLKKASRIEDVILICRHGRVPDGPRVIDRKHSPPPEAPHG